MRKERLVTRTFTIYDAEVLGFDTETSEKEIKHFNFTKKFSDKKKLVDFIRKSEEKNNSSFVPVKVISISTKNELRGMTETHFIEESKIIPDRAQKNTENN